MKLTAMALIAAVLVAAAIATGGPAEPEPAWGPETEGCRAAIIMERKSYRFDKPIAVRLVIENVGEGAVEIRDGGLLAGYRFEIQTTGPLTDPDAKPALLTLEGKRQAELAAEEQEIVRLEPGETHSIAVVMLNRLYDLTLIKEYAVTAYRTVRRPGQDNEWIEVPSNTIMIDVHWHAPPSRR